MRVFEIDGRFIDLDSITMIDPVIEVKQGWDTWTFAVHCKLHEKPLWIGDEITTKKWRSREEIIAIRCTLINAWSKP